MGPVSGTPPFHRGTPGFNSTESGWAVCSSIRLLATVTATENPAGTLLLVLDFSNCESSSCVHGWRGSPRSERPRGLNRGTAVSI